LKPKLTVAEFSGVGIRPTVEVADTELVTAMEFEGDEGLEHYIGLHNFYVITRYNHSAMYAMAVYQLSQRIAGQLQQ